MALIGGSCFLWTEKFVVSQEISGKKRQEIYDIGKADVVSWELPHNAKFKRNVQVRQLQSS